MEISVIIVVRNEQDFILECIKSIEKQFSIEDSWELIIVDGLSEDSTKVKAEEYLSKQKYKYLIVDNPKKTLAPGWNIGIKKASGKYVIRPDAHATLSDSYIRLGIKSLMKDEKIASVGGVLITGAKTFSGEINKNILESIIGVGYSFRTKHISSYVDANVYAIYKKSIFDEVGLFRENLRRHEDTDMHQRIIGKGYRLYQNSEMKCIYYCRNTISGLLRQMFNNGFYSNEAFGSLRLRHMIPMIFVITLILLLFLSFFNVYVNYFFILFVVLYCLTILFFMVKKLLKERRPSILISLFIIPLVHLTYGLGTLTGLITKYLKL